jgi:vancomycin resistance protein YoaR
VTDRNSTRERAGGRIVAVVVVVLALLLGGGYAAAYAGAGDKVPRGTTIAGVEIGGRTTTDAAEALRLGLAERLNRPITVTVDGKSQVVTPRDAGLGVDYSASVAAAGGGRSWELSRLWDYYTGPDEVDPVVTVNDERMDAVVDRLSATMGTAPRDGAVGFRGNRIQVTQPRPGEQIDGEETRAALQAAYLEDQQVAELPLHKIAPDIDDTDVSDALAEFANPALSGPVTLSFDGADVRLRPAEFAGVLGMKAKGGRLVPDLDEAKLTGLVAGAVGDEGDPVAATVALVGGRPKVIPAKPGVGYDPADVTDAFLELVTRPEGKREMTVKATVEDPEFTTRDARKLGIEEKVSTFTTYYPYAEYRNVNIGRAGELIDGTVLRPGETFSLNDIVGERTRENGFTEGTVISDGIFKEDLGGGVSQMATTTFNAMFFAGLEDIEHKPHSVYIDRYPVGREATVAWGAVDLRFRNDTKYGVLIDTSVTPSTPSSQGVVTVSMWSTKVWDVTATTSERYNSTEPETRTLNTEDCLPNEGYDGFDVDVTRHFRRPGSSTLHHSEVFHTTYIPSDTVICETPTG